MPSLIGRCGGGSSTNIFYATGIDSGGFAVSGVPKTIKLGSFETDDNAHVALDFQGALVGEIILVSSAYLYTITATIHWDAFVGSRTFTLSTTDGQSGWFVPFTVTSTDDVQMLTAVCRLDSTAPTKIVCTAAQSTGTNKTWIATTILVQACQFV